MVQVLTKDLNRKYNRISDDEDAIELNNDILDNNTLDRYFASYLTLQKISKCNMNITSELVLQYFKKILIFHTIMTQYLFRNKHDAYPLIDLLISDISKYIDVGPIQFTDIIAHPILMSILIKNNITDITQIMSSESCYYDHNNSTVLCPSEITFELNGKFYYNYYNILLNYKLIDKPDIHHILITLYSDDRYMNRYFYPYIINVSDEDYVKIMEFINNDENNQKYKHILQNNVNFSPDQIFDED